MIQRSADTPSASIGEALLMMSIERGQYFSLNSVAARIWEMLEQPATPDIVSHRLCEEYDVAPDVCAEQVSRFLAKLRELELVIEVCA